MDDNSAADILRTAIRSGDASWADVGAGDGTFTFPLARLLGHEATVFAIDIDPKAVLTGK